MENQNQSCCHIFGHRFAGAVLIGALVVFLAVLTVFIAVGIQNKIKEGRYIGQGDELKNTITVSDTGEIYAKPDLGLIIFSVRTSGKTVAVASGENTQKMNAVIEAVKKNGVEDKDLKTTSYNIYPKYDYPQYSGRQVLAGYEVYQSLEVKIRQTEKAGEIIEAASAAGSNEVGSLNFIVDKEEDLKKQAREEAIKKAKAKAEELADSLDVDLVKIVSFNENSVTPYFYGAYDKAMGMGGGGVEAAAPQVQTGENKISVTVNITYEID